MAAQGVSEWAMQASFPFLDMSVFSSWVVIQLMLAAFVAGMARGFSGFGAALIFIPLASVSIGPRVAAPLLLIIDTIAAIGLIPNAWRNANKKEVGVMAVGTVFGVPLGTLALTQIDPVTIRWILVALIAPSLFLLVSGWRYHGQPKSMLTTGVGVVSGLMHGLAQIGGPPVVLYWLGGQGQAGNVRANFVLFFVSTTVCTLVTYSIGGLFTGDVLGLSLVTLPAYAVGLWLGSKMFGLASDTTFRRMSYTMIAGAVIISLPVWDGVIR